MNQIIFGLALVLFNFIAVYSSPESSMAVDILPDFIGYLILWLMLEKRRFNKPMKGLYVTAAVMIPVTFLVFLAQVQNLIFDGISTDPRDTGWRLLNAILTGVSYVYTEYYGFVMLLAVLTAGWLLVAMLEYWSRTNRHKMQCNVCRAGLALCALTGLCHLGSTLVILPFSWNFLVYPLSLLILVCVGFSLRNVPEIETPSHA